MVLGMGTVLAFLVILIFMMNLQTKILQRFFPEPKGKAGAASVASGEKPKDNKKIAAIAAAIMHHNNV